MANKVAQSLNKDDIRTFSTKKTYTAATAPVAQGPEVHYDLSYDYSKFIVRSTYDSDLKRAEIFLRNIVS